MVQFTHSRILPIYTTRATTPDLISYSANFTIWDNTPWTDSLASFLLHPNLHSLHTCGFAHWHMAAALGWDLSGAEAAFPRLLSGYFDVSWVCSSAATTTKQMYCSTKAPAQALCRRKQLYSWK